MPASMPRRINYLRMSITDRCNLRCGYCTYWQKFERLSPGEILSYEELLRLAAVAARIGIRKIRITGGEPLVRRGVVDFIKGLHRVPGLDEVCLTTNGVLLPELAPALYEAGLRHLNISLDTLRRERYLEITGRDNWQEVMAGLEMALSLGFQPLKINCVVLKGINDDELMDLALLTQYHPVQVRFIELMPTVSQDWWERHYFPTSAVLRQLAGLGRLSPVIPAATAGPARVFRAPGFQGELGFISPMSNHHCSSCNRLRLTTAGQLRPCLLRSMEFDFKASLRQGVSDFLLGFLFKEAIRLKQKKEYSLPISRAVYNDFSMVSIGG
ncbi:MAG: GTP 3',8-cyclase MoaA [Deltaproteobacteria bacterium]|nr:GTP 3',8-cyclase MoaA [Deltaproteobacteria bacterium]